MKTAFYSLLAALMLTGFQQAAAQQSRVYVDSDSQVAKNHMNFNAFYLTHHIVGDAFYETELYKTVEQHEIYEVVEGVMYHVSPTSDVNIGIKQESGFDIQMQFSIKEHPKHGQTLVMKINFDEETRKLTNAISRNSAMLRWYKIWDGRLTMSDDLYSSDAEAEKTDQIDLTYFLIFDDNASNDARGYGMIGQLKSSAKQKLFGTAFSVHLAMIQGKMEKAQMELQKLKKIYEGNKAELADFESVPLLIEAELQVFKRLNR